MAEPNINFTQGKAWGGTQMDPTLFKIVSVLFGFVGFDHFILRSPKTGLLKFIVNLCSLGFWYFYDLIQLFYDGDFVKQYGLSYPFYGPSGLGAGIFHEAGKERAPDDSASPFYFLLYSILSFLPFGVSNAVVGDLKGGLTKFILVSLSSAILFNFMALAISWINPFIYIGNWFSFFLSFLTIYPLLFGVLWSSYSLWTVLFNTQSLFTKGTDRMFPMNLILGEEYGPAPHLLSSKYKKEIQEANAADKSKEDSGFFGSIVSLLKILPEQLIPPAKEAISEVKDASVGVIQGVEKVVEAAAGPVKGLSALSLAVPLAATKAVEGLSAFTDPKALQEAAKSQVGGGLLLNSSDTSLYSNIFMGFLVFIVLGGFAASYLRNRTQKSKDENKENREDVPPDSNNGNDFPPGPAAL